MAVETKVGGLLLNGSFEQGSGTDAYNWLEEAYGPTYDAYTRRESANHYSGSWSIFTYSVGSNGWARATSDAFTLRAKQFIYYYRVQYNNPYSAKFQLLDASDDSLLAEDAFTGSAAAAWTKRIFDVSAYIGQSVKVRVWATTTSHGNGCKINWDFIREDIPSWVHKCVCDLGNEGLALTESLALKEQETVAISSLLTENLALKETLAGFGFILTESLALLEDLTQYARGLPLEESLALKEEETADISALLTESLALKEQLTEFGLSLQESLALKEQLTEFGLSLQESLALKEQLTEFGLSLQESLALKETETADIQALMIESLALKEDLTQLGRALTLEESLALLEDVHAETLLFKVDASGNVIIPSLKDAGDAYIYTDSEGKLHRGAGYP